MWLCLCPTFPPALSQAYTTRANTPAWTSQSVQSPRIISFGWHLSLETPATVGELSWRGGKLILQTDLEPFGYGILVYGNRRRSLEAVHGFWVPEVQRPSDASPSKPHPMGRWSWKEIRVWPLLVHDKAGSVSMCLSPTVDLCSTQENTFEGNTFYLSLLNSVNFFMISLFYGTNSIQIFPWSLFQGGLRPAL